jgi:hypothetical protein
LGCRRQRLCLDARGGRARHPKAARQSCAAGVAGSRTLSLETTVEDSTEANKGNRDRAFKGKCSVSWVHPRGDPIRSGIRFRQDGLRHSVSAIRGYQSGFEDPLQPGLRSLQLRSAPPPRLLWAPNWPGSGKPVVGLIENVLSLPLAYHSLTCGFHRRAGRPLNVEVEAR